MGAISQQGAISFFCVLESAIVLWDGVFELSESEFLTIHRKAKTAVPKRSTVRRTKGRGGWIKQPAGALMMNLESDPESTATCKKPFVTQTLYVCDLSHVICIQTA